MLNALARPYIVLRRAVPVMYVERTYFVPRIYFQSQSLETIVLASVPYRMAYAFAALLCIVWVPEKRRSFIIRHAPPNSREI